MALLHPQSQGHAIGGLNGRPFALASRQAYASYLNAVTTGAPS